MIEYTVSRDKNDKFHVFGPINETSVALEVPSNNPHKKYYIDLFLHKADIERGIQFLTLITEDNDITINEALFIAGLNNCIKCFKRSKSRFKLDKHVIFGSNPDQLNKFVYFEALRDKHYDHDENGMVQTIAFLLTHPTKNGFFLGQPSVAWNRIKLDFYSCGQRLRYIMNIVLYYLSKEIDKTGYLIISEYKGITADELLSWKPAKLKPATNTSPRSNE